MRQAVLMLYRLIVQVGLVLAFYSLFRICFYAFNADFFQLKPERLLELLVSGVRFDLSAVMVVNTLFILLSLWPYPRQDAAKAHRWRYWVFMLPNSLAFLFEIADWKYYAFNQKRATAGILDVLGKQGDFINLLPAFLKDFWYLFLLAALSIAALSRCFNITETYFVRKFFLLKWRNGGEESRLIRLVYHLAIFLIGIGGALIGIRGGLQLVPVNIRNALEVARPEEAALVLNTPFSIIHSMASEELQEVHYMDSATAWSLVQPIKYYGRPGDFLEKNVVIIILESFSRSFTRLGAVDTSYTPFLDSLMNHSRTYTRAFANGLHSADAVPAIVAGIPALMREPFGTSVYSNNSVEALPLLLKERGYYSAFFHGAANGSMSFDIFARLAGYDAYFGRNEYPDGRDYDGNWGIYDAPFFQYFASCLDTLPRPFHAVLFSLSSHHPFTLPEDFKKEHRLQGNTIFNAVRYTDAALRTLFDSISRRDWFMETLFVIVADHCFPNATDTYSHSGNGRYQIPILFYVPDGSLLPGFDSTPVQQIDILPGVLDYLNYPDSFFTLGRSLFDTNTTGLVIQKWNEGYQWINQGYQFDFFSDSLHGVFIYPIDSMKRHNLLPEVVPKEGFRNGKAFIQVYNAAMIRNTLNWTEIQKRR